MIGNPLLLGGGDYEISRSVRLRSSASAYFNRTVWGSGNRKTWTYSFWLKRGVLNSERVIAGAYDGTSTWASRFLFTSSNALAFDLGLSAQNQTLTTAVFRDPSAWYHIVLVIDTTQSQTLHSQPDSRVRIYVNGSQQTTSGTLPTLNVDTQFFINTRPNYIGTRNTEFFDGYLTEINFIDGQALTPSSFGETDAVTGVWKPKKYTGTYGTNGFYLNFSDNSAATAAAIGKDYSGNGNNWTPNNISVTAGATYDSMLDVPTPWADGGNGRGNYAVMNPLTQRWSQPNSVYSEGNLKVSTSSANSAYSLGTIFQSTGKWYWEVSVVATGTTAIGVGVGDLLIQNTTQTNSVQYLSNGNKNVGGSSTSYGATFTTNDIIGVALDKDGGTITFYKNNTSQGAITLPSNVELSAWLDINTPAVFAINFGQRPFAYTPPSGFKALHTGNLPEPTIKKGNLYFDATTYSGASTSQNVVNAGGFQPDLVWIKSRTGTNSHILQDALRGAGKTLFSNSTSAESGNAGDLIGAFNSNGFSVNDTYLGGGGGGGTNGVGGTYVAWQWKEGATQGFDIVTYTGTGSLRTVNHSLGVAPRMMIIKGRDGTANNWGVYHASVGNTASLFLNLTNAQDVGSAYWNNTTPTSTQFTLNTGSNTNSNGVNYVAYLFAEVAGFSRFGSYTGNGSTDGPFVFCGFRPRWVMIKRTDSADNWFIWDTQRSATNATNHMLFADLSNAEATGGNYNDILSNGFKIRETNSGRNASGGTYIFAAFAENAFRYALAR